MSRNEKTSGEVCGAMLYLQSKKYRCERSAGHAGSHRDVYEELDWDAPPNEREWRPVPVTADAPLVHRFASSRRDVGENLCTTTGGARTSILREVTCRLCIEAGKVRIDEAGALAPASAARQAIAATDPDAPTANADVILSGAPRPASAPNGELDALAQRIAKGRSKYPTGCTLLSLLDEAGEVAHAVNKKESNDRVRDELLDVAAVAMRLYAGEIDTAWTPNFGGPASAIPDLMDRMLEQYNLGYAQAKDEERRRSASRPNGEEAFREGYWWGRGSVGDDAASDIERCVYEWKRGESGPDVAPRPGSASPLFAPENVLATLESLREELAARNKRIAEWLAYDEIREQLMVRTMVSRDAARIEWERFRALIVRLTASDESRHAAMGDALHALKRTEVGR